MNLFAIENSLQHYLSEVPEEEAAQLTFYQGLWKLLIERSNELEKEHPYTCASEEEIAQIYWNYEPQLMSHPVRIDQDEFVATLEAVSAYLQKHAGFEDSLTSDLEKLDWAAVVAASPLTLAQTYPAQYLEDTLKDAEELGISADIPLSVVGSIVMYALRAHVAKPAAAIMRKAPMKEGAQNQHTRPLSCPVCGGHASSGFVGETAASEGQGAELFCPICGVTWPFERIRCAQCGQTQQGKLHYFNLEGDNAHRLHTCDVCGEYTRMVFQEDVDAKVGICMDVEDVVMARLDAVARHPSFSSKAKTHRPTHG